MGLISLQVMHHLGNLKISDFRIQSFNSKGRGCRFPSTIDLTTVKHQLCLNDWEFAKATMNINRILIKNSKLVFFRSVSDFSYLRLPLNYCNSRHDRKQCCLFLTAPLYKQTWYHYIHIQKIYQLIVLWPLLMSWFTKAPQISYKAHFIANYISEGKNPWTTSLGPSINDLGDSVWY